MPPTFGYREQRPERPRRVQRTDLPTIRHPPRCPGCGFSVSAHGDVCEVCAVKPLYRAPVATMELSAQPVPVYETEGRHMGQPIAR